MFILYIVEMRVFTEAHVFRLRFKTVSLKLFYKCCVLKLLYRFDCVNRHGSDPCCHCVTYSVYTTECLPAYTDDIYELDKAVI